LGDPASLPLEGLLYSPLGRSAEQRSAAGMKQPAV